MEENAKIQDGDDKMLSILILKLSKLHVLLYFSTYKLRVNMLCYIKNIFCFLDELIMFSIQLPALSQLFILG